MPDAPPATTETKHYTDGSSATGPGPLPDHSPEQQARAKVVAAVLTENGMPVSSPDEGDLDDVERERWNACIDIVRRLDAWKPPPLPRYLPTDPVPEDFMAIEHEQYPLCPECGEVTDLIAYAYNEGRAWKCDCGWKGELHV